MNSTLEQLLSPQEIADLQQPIHQARGLPGKAYGEDFFQLEQQMLFPRSWCAIATGAEIPNAGDVMAVDLAGRPLLVVRGQNGDINCFYNICRHRGNKLVEGKDCALRRLSCSWHAWTYDLDGNLVSTPDLGGGGVHHATGFDHQSLGLKRVRSARWLDYILVNLDGKAPPVEEHLAVLDTFLSRVDLSVMQHGATWDYTYPGNWKVTIEGAIEDYHVPWGHPQVVRGMKSRTGCIDTAPGCFAATTSTWVYGEGEAPIRYKNDAIPSIPGIHPSAPVQSQIISVFPTGLIGVMSDHLMLGQILPAGWNKTLLRFNYYFVGSAATDSRCADARRDIIDGWTKIVEQDFPFVRNVHNMYQVRDELAIDTRFSPHWEGAVLHFQRMVVEALTQRTAGEGIDE